MRTVLIAALCVPFLVGCSGMLADNAIKQGQEKCAAQGKQFVQDNVEKHDNPIYSSAEVTGHCAGPGEPGYVAPSN